MDAEILQGFVKQTEEYLPQIRGGILICAQASGIYGEISASLRQMTAIRTAASIIGFGKIAQVCTDFERELKAAASGDAAAQNNALTDEDARRLLDRLAELEFLLAQIHFGVKDSPDSVAEFVEESFGQIELTRNNKSVAEQLPQPFAEEFEIDAEMLEIFALEADALTGSFQSNLKTLESFPANREALPEMRRAAHTLKGSAGVVGLKILSQLAHRVEDLLDCLAENKRAGDEETFELLRAATDCFEALASGETTAQLTGKIARIYQNSDKIIASLQTRIPQSGEREISNQSALEMRGAKVITESENPKSVVRVSLEKLDELAEIADGLCVNRTIFEQHFAEFDRAANDNLASLFESQCRLIEEMRRKLRRLRMVRFGSLGARLQRTARVACDEEDKHVELFIEGENLEIDTQILDSLIEPLLHLLRNAVAHGVEAPDLRRLLGKPETGRIILHARLEKDSVVVSVSDDGRGISADALREKAVASGFVSRRRADDMTDAEVFELIFLHGLTTAEKLSQTAGRGIGMNIVKTGVERLRGTIAIESEARRGTTFTVRLPSGVAASANQLSVLIVDDSPSVRHAIAGLIKNAGWKPETAGNGFEALEILRAAKSLPDLILTDLDMPQMDGYELLTLLKNQENFRKIPVFMITSRTNAEQRSKAFALGACEYLTKPYDDEFLVNKIKNTVGFV